jgi:hypothetical protein
MHRTCLVAVAIFGLISGCGQAAEQAPAGNHYPTHSSLVEIAKREAQEEGGTLVAFSESSFKSVPYFVTVTYSDASENDPATCRLKIAESVAGKIHVVEETDHLLFCSTVVAAEIERKQLFVNADQGAISIQEQRDKKKSAFEFVNDNGDWVVSKVAFNYPEQDTTTDELRVINEEGAFPGGMQRTRVSDFDARSAKLARNIVR